MIGLPASQRPDSPHKHFLCYVLSIFPMSQHPPAKSEHDGLEPFDEQADSFLVSVQDSAYEFGLCLRHADAQSAMGFTPALARAFPNSGLIALVSTPFSGRTGPGRSER